MLSINVRPKFFNRRHILVKTKYRVKLSSPNNRTTLTEAQEVLPVTIGNLSKQFFIL